MNLYESMRASQLGRDVPVSKVRTFSALCAIALVCGCISADSTRADFLGLGLFGPKGDTNSQQRQTVQNESATMLQQLYDLKPEMRDRIANAAGYATFKKTDIHLLMVASGNGYGVLVNNQTGQQTYMRVASLGGGVGLGVNDLRVIFVFNDPSVMQQFVTQGWQFGGNADANAQLNNVGVSATQTAQANVNFDDGTVAGASNTNIGAATANRNAQGKNVAVGNGMEIYQFTESGVALQATVSGTKYWADPDLNN